MKLTKLHIVFGSLFTATALLGALPEMSIDRYSHTATLLNDGKVLVAGGYNYNAGAVASAELYDPTTGTFTLTGSMSVSRFRYTATLLNNGKVLVIGGWGNGPGNSAFLASAELYDETTGAFTPTGYMSAPRSLHTATLLADGKVLVTGGFSSSSAVTVASAEIYDPNTGTFTATGSMSADRYSHAATLLADGQVLVIGGYSSGGYLASAELYDPGTGTFIPTADMLANRYLHTATLLANGKVLVAGGGGYGNGVFFPLAGELYDPSTGTFTLTGSMSVGREGHTATLLADGKVFLTGGEDCYPITDSELFDPNAGTFAQVRSMSVTRSFHTATLLGNGKVLVTGGKGPINVGVSSAEELDPEELIGPSRFVSSGSMTVARFQHTATLLDNGQVLVTGGHDTNTTDFSNGIGNTAELYDPTSGNFTITGSLLVGRVAHTATLVPGGKVVVIGGVNASGTYPRAVELHDPSTDTSTQSGNLLSAGRVYHTATLLGNGKVLVTGGYDYDLGIVASAELYDPIIGTFTSTGSMSTPRSFHTATLLASGQVLIIGGTGNSAELYDPSTGLFTLTGSMSVGREGHAATLLTNGQVLVTGGFGNTYLDSAELYDPSTGTFSATGNLSVFRYRHTAILLTNGQVLVAGGVTRSSSELYDPSTGTFTPTSSMSVARYYHTATLLNNGNILVAGGEDCVGKALASTQLFVGDGGAHHPPLAQDDFITVGSASGVNTIPVLANDTDPNHGSLTITTVSQGMNGLVAITPSGSTLTYTPNRNSCSNDSFTYTISNGAGDSATALVHVTVVDTTPPSIGPCPANQAVNATSPAGAVVAFATPIASDNCSVASVTCVPASGSTFPIGTTQVTCTATDASWNSATCGFVVVVKLTKTVIVQLKDSLGNPLAGGKAQYYSGGWHDIGLTGADGRVSVELLAGNYTFSVDYAFGRVQKAQSITADSVIGFQTQRAVVRLQDSTGDPLAGGKAQYYAGGWHDIGLTGADGSVSVELLPTSYTFSVDYAFGRVQKAQNIAVDPAIVFQTPRAVVRLQDSMGNPLAGGKAQYYSGGWHDIGLTGVDGSVSVELLPGNYTFSVDYAFGRVQKTQNIATDPNVVFQTQRAVTRLIDSTGNPLAVAKAQYYAGGWHDIGLTGADGTVSVELLPASYTFSVDYAFGRVQKSQNIGTDSQVIFQTGRIHSASGTCIQYYGSGWHSFLNDMELLPVTFTFRFNDGTPNNSAAVVAGTVTNIH